MDCKTARLLLSFARPCATQREAGEVEDLDLHLAECPQCSALAHIESKVDEHIGLAMRDVPVPAGLRSRLLAALEPPTLPWHRRRGMRWAAGVGVAAVVALAVFLGLEQKKLRSVDLEYWANETSAKIANPSAENVQEYFGQAYGIHTVAPADFNYRFLTYYDLANFDGERVPLLVFRNGDQQARVWILPGKRFDIQGALAATPPPPSTVHVEVRAHPGNPQFAFLVVYTGESLQPFLTDEQRPPT